VSILLDGKRVVPYSKSMREILNITPIALYFMVGVISLVMAYKSLFFKKFIPFHEQAAGKPLESLDLPIQHVIIALMRVSGLGFLVVALLLCIFPVVNYFRPDAFAKYAVPAISFLYCSGLFVTNYYLHKQTKAKTPWKGALAAMALISIGIVISSL
jgi:hypothetical protein